MTNLLTILYITCPSQEKAKELALHLLQKKLIACANISPAASMYWWQEALQNDNEYVVIAKTVPELAAQIEHEVEFIHPHEVPCIIQIPACANAKYISWVKSVIKS